MEVALPVAFKMAAERREDIERQTRLGCRDALREVRLMERMPPEIKALLQPPGRVEEFESAVDEDEALPAPLWEPETVS